MRNGSELTNTDDIELESALEKLALDLGRDAVETDMALGVDGRWGHRRHCFCLAGSWVNRLHTGLNPSSKARIARF